MHLYTLSNGLLGTHVTWQDVELEMQKVLGTTATFGRNKSAFCVSGLKGATSVMALIDANWNVEGEKSSNQKLPEQFLIKIASQSNLLLKTAMLECQDVDCCREEKMKKLEVLTKVVHNREVLAYKLLKTEAFSNIPIAKVFAYRKFDEQNQNKGFIILEHVPNSKHVGTRVREKIAYQNIIPLIKSYAEFSASALKLDKDQRSLIFSMDDGMIDVILAEYLDEKVWSRSQNLLRRYFPDKYQEKLEEIIGVYNNYYLKEGMIEKYKNICEFLGHTPVLVHGNLSKSNILWTKCEQRHKLANIIDWETICFQSPSLDLSRLLVSCLELIDLKNYSKDLLQIYYETFTERISDDADLFNFQMIEASFNLYFPLMALSEITEIVPYLGNELDNREEIEEELTSYIDEVFEVHEWNLSNCSNFFVIKNEN